MIISGTGEGKKMKRQELCALCREEQGEAGSGRFQVEMILRLMRYFGMGGHFKGDVFN